jgi:Tol biopolymer transport system component
MMLTDGGENAEAYWKDDGSELIYQARRGDRGCDAIRIMGADGSSPRTIHPQGANTCAYFLKGGERVIFASTRSGGEGCPTPPDRSQGYVWPLYDDYEIYTARPDGSDLQRLTNTPGYDAEATVGPDGTVLFTSVRDGDLEIYSMDPDGSNVKRLTNAPGYDGGPFFSPDGTKIVYRAHRPDSPESLKDYQDLLAQGLVRPSRLEVWVMDADGSNQRQVTNLNGAAFCPYFTPDSQAILFSSNHLDPRKRNFDLFLVTLDGTKLERVTWNESFDGFPMFSPDGKKLAFCSNRGNSTEGDTNVFVADWVAGPPS